MFLFFSIILCSIFHLVYALQGNELQIKGVADARRVFEQFDTSNEYDDGKFQKIIDIQQLFRLLFIW